ncbi:MAG: dihydroorotase [Gammaproteobacteria bacterium]|nr:dihydroorotase [Gammaproteobacteria bacterium]
MTDENLLITNAQICNEGRVTPGDVLMRRGRIEKVAKQIPAGRVDRIIDARGKYLLPGFIDDQVHFREPGLTHKGDIATESAAAVAGGITSFMDMPNTIPNVTSRAVLMDKFRLARGRSRANFSFYFGGANDNLDEIRALQPGDCCGVKIFMGASTGNMLVDDPQVLELIFAECPLLIATHCEDTPTIKANEERFRQQYGEDVPFSAHPLIRSEEACYKSTVLATSLARRHGTRLHVLHLTTARELELFEPGPLAGKRITAEVCVHMLHFDDRAYAARGPLIKCNPAIKTPADRQALMAGLVDGRLAVVATDHAPHTLEEKGQKYFKCPSGLPLVQHALLMMLEHVHDGTLPLELVVEKTSHSVADLFGIRDRGYIREGYFADLVLVDHKTPTTVRREDVLSKCGWSPFEGDTFRSSIVTTIVNGTVAYENGRVTDAVAGQRLVCGDRV